jgi:group I intron endonuclease
MSKGVIYCAHCLSTGKKYVGQTVDYKRRLIRHKSDFKNIDTKFYRSIRKYGWNNFVWGIIEETNCENLSDLEIFYIKKFNSYENGYNSTPGGKAGLDYKKLFKYEFINQNGEIAKGKNLTKFCRENNLNRRHMIEVINGKALSHKGWKLLTTEKVGHEYRTEKQAKIFKIISPNDEIVVAKNIRKFCRDNNLNYEKIRMVLNGKRKSYKGWRLEGNPRNGYITASQNRKKKFQIVSPDGELMEFYGIQDFCQKYNLNPSSISILLSGKRKSNKGWTLPENEITKNILKSPTGDIVSITNITKFSKENNLTPSAIVAVLKGKRKHHKGWTIP